MKPARAHRLTKANKKRALKRAAKNPNWLNDVAGSLYYAKAPRFSRGAASPVRHLVKDGVPVEAPQPEPEVMSA